MRTEELAAQLAAMSGQLGDLAAKLAAQSAAEAAAAKPKTKKAEPAPAAKAPTIEDVRAALTKLASEKGASVSKQLLKDYGAEKLSDIAAQDFPELLAKVEEATQ